MKYTFAKLWFAIITSFFFVDALGRRKSLFVGTTLQMISDIYLGVYVRYRQQGPVSHAASTGAIAFIFIHGFAYCVGKIAILVDQTSTNLSERTIHSALYIRSRVVAKSYPLVWGSSFAEFPLALHFRHGIWCSVSTCSDSQLGRISVLRHLVLLGRRLRLFHGP